MLRGGTQLTLLTLPSNSQGWSEVWSARGEDPCCHYTPLSSDVSSAVFRAMMMELRLSAVCSMLHAHWPLQWQTLHVPHDITADLSCIITDELIKTQIWNSNGQWPQEDWTQGWNTGTPYLARARIKGKKRESCELSINNCKSQCLSELIWIAIAVPWTCVG